MKNIIKPAGMALLCVAVVLCFIFIGQAKTTYTISDGRKSSVMNSYSKDVASILKTAGVEFGYGDYYNVTEFDGIVHVNIVRTMFVTINYDGTKKIIPMYGGTVADALMAGDITLGPDDFTDVPLADNVYDGMSITVTRAEITYKTVEMTIDYDTEYVANGELYEGRSNLVSPGQDGSKILVYKSVYINGMLQDLTLYTEDVVAEPVPAKVEYGTKTKLPDTTYKKYEHPAASIANVSGTVTASYGKTYTYIDKVGVTATAYTVGPYGHGITASGAMAQVGIIAADPRVLPLGTTVYVVSASGSWEYGYAVVGDTGGSIKGNRIDLFYDTEGECIQFGVRDAVVYVISYPK